VQATRPSAEVPVAYQAAVALMNALLRFPLQETTVPLMQAALVARARWQIDYWDAAIVEAARALSCDTLLTEDLQHGQDFNGVLVVNPFR